MEKRYNAKILRDLGTNELTRLLRNMDHALMPLNAIRAQYGSIQNPKAAGADEMSDPSRIKNVKKVRARILTVLNERRVIN